MVATSQSIPDLDRNGLRSFGFTTGFIVAGLFGLFFPWLLSRDLPLWPWVICVTLVAWALIAPSGLRPIYRGWMRFGLIMGKITTPIILSLVFFIAITPLAIVRSLMGRDSLARTFDENADSYRVPSRKPSRDGMTRPF